MNIELIIKLCKYDPEKIGIAILREQGFFVKQHALSGNISVYSSENGKLLCFVDTGAIVP